MGEGVQGLLKPWVADTPQQAAPPVGMNAMRNQRACHAGTGGGGLWVSVATLPYGGCSASRRAYSCACPYAPLPGGGVDAAAAIPPAVH